MNKNKLISTEKLESAFKIFDKVSDILIILKIENIYILNNF